MLSWADLLQYDNRSLSAKLPRRPEVENEYRRHAESVRAAGISMEDYILRNVMRGNDVCLVPNHFPYDTADGIVHYILWTAANLDLESARSITNEHFPGHQAIIFQNDLAAKSVKGIAHYHVFLRDNK